MATFELTARQQMYLGGTNLIPKGERLTMNIHTMGIQPYNIFSNPESRKQAIQQFAVHGVDLKPNSPFLTNGHWDVRRVPERTISKAIEQNPYEHPLPHFEKTTDVIVDDVEMKKGCINLVKEFHEKELDFRFADCGIGGRCELALDFYEGIKSEMGINADLQFSNMPDGKLGGYDIKTNSIELNSSYLENPDCEDLLNTILHESRHAFQAKCIDHPASVTVKENVIDVWKDNMDHYISPEFDFEAYENQEIEKDANYFADSVMKKGTNLIYA